MFEFIFKKNINTPQPSEVPEPLMSIWMFIHFVGTNTFYIYFDTEEGLKEFLEELGIDYKKPLKVSCNQLESRVEVYIEKRIRKEYIDLIEYNSVYRGTIEIPNNLLETKTKTGIQIGMTYSEEDECTLIFINFQKEMKRLK